MDIEPVKAEVSIDEFNKIDLRVCLVLKCEELKRSRNLLRLDLDDGLGGRTIVSSIHPWYEPEDMVGKKIIVVANLETTKFCNVKSQGMLLGGDTQSGGCSVIFVDAAVPVGFKVH